MRRPLCRRYFPRQPRWNISMQRRFWWQRHRPSLHQTRSRQPKQTVFVERHR
ncbi:hypothetical protein B0T16DRAFT_423898 [Cercophora newfieldiana]|uniref:Uncharacterized protein n=1 Tax=Cercophora newfieldiana TaxID=92897 RepID=A0AA40CJY4_9PEZI|nr:hypothetical protein B0T16DRAFT_423898 [Cercophora newfieldiana]